jgi:hypothetical protein
MDLWQPMMKKLRVLQWLEGALLSVPSQSWWWKKHI